MKDDLEIFSNAPENASLQELGTYLDEACAGDPELRARVEALFAADLATLGLVDHVPRALEAALQPAGAEADRWEQAGDVIGPYKLLQKIGEGGFGVVFMAEQTEPVRRRVALKIIKEGMDTRQVIARFEAERQALAMMEHQNIAKVLDAGASGSGRPYFVMELVRGTPITTFCDEQELDTRQRLSLFQDVCSAVGHAHQKGIIHRDLKPSNILVGLDGDTPIVKVIDFGVAKATQLQLTDKTLFTRFEQFIGTPLYISPEQASLSPIDIDTRSDIYSLGVLLYELLSGKPPIDQEELMKAGFDEMRRLIREQEPPKPSTRLSTATDAERKTIAKARHTEPHKLGLFIKGDLDWIVLKTLEKDRKRRYDTAASLSRDIDHFLNDEMVSATPPSASYKIQKFAQRNKGRLVAVAAVALALIAGTITSTSQWFRAETAAEKSQEAATAAENARDAEQSQRAIAEERLRESARSDRVMARDLLGNDRELDAMAYLARSSRHDPAATEVFDEAIAILQSWKRPGLLTSLEDPLNNIEYLFGRLSHTWSLNGERIAYFGNIGEGSDQVVGRIWNSTTGKVEHTFVPKEDNETVAGVHFDGEGNGLILTWTKDSQSVAGPVRIWNEARPNSPVPLEGVGRTSWPVSFSGRGSLVLIAEHTGSEQPEDQNWFKTISVWKTDTGQRLARLAHEDPVIYARFSTDRRKILTTTRRSQSDGSGAKGWSVNAWDVESGRLLASAKDARGISPDGSLTATDTGLRDIERSEDSVRLQVEKLGLPTKSNQSGIVMAHPIGHTVRNEGEERRQTRWFSPCLTRFAAEDDTGLGLWNAHTGRRIGNLLGAGQKHRQRYVAFSPDGLMMFTAERGETRVWNARSGELLTIIGGTAVKFSPDSRRLLTSSGEVWETVSRELGPKLKARIPRFLRDGSRVIALTGDSRGVTIFNHPDTTIRATSKTAYIIRKLALSPSEKMFATMEMSGAVTLWETETGSRLHKWHFNRGGTYVHSKQGRLAFSPEDGILAVSIATSQSEAETLLLDLETKQITRTIPGWDPRFSPDGKELAVALSREPKIVVYDTENWEVLAEHQGIWIMLRYRPDGSGAVTASKQKDSRTWIIRDVASGDVIRSMDAKGMEYVDDLVFSPDGGALAHDFSRVSEPVPVYDSRNGESLGTIPEPYNRLSLDSRYYWRWTDRGRAFQILPAVEVGARLPEWWGDFLEVLSWRYFAEEGKVEKLAPVDWEERRERLLSALRDDRSEAAELARSFLPAFDADGRSALRNRIAESLITPHASLDHLEWAYRLNPSHPLIHLALAQSAESYTHAAFLARFGKGRLPDEPEMMRRAAALEPNFEVLRIRESTLRRNWEEAHRLLGELDWNAALKRNPGLDSDLEIMKAFLLASAVDRDPANREEYEQSCAKLLPKTAQSETPGDFLKALKAILIVAPPEGGSPLLETALDYVSDDKSKALYPPDAHSRGMAAYRAGNYDKAMEHFKFQTRSIVSLGFHAMAAFATGDTDLAVEKLEAAEVKLSAPDKWMNWWDLLLGELAVKEARATLETPE